jgi:acetylornithine/succinyldiaminopimelate/putrescine aminotransferase
MVGMRSDIQAHFATQSTGWGSTYHAHPVAMACAYATLKHMIDSDVMGNVEKMGKVGAHIYLVCTIVYSVFIKLCKYICTSINVQHTPKINDIVLTFIATITQQR